MNLFYWLAGADSNDLEQCSISEKIKIDTVSKSV